MDWVGGLIEKTFDRVDDGAFWQAFTNFPEVWAAIANSPFNRERLPRPWSVGNDWAFWGPPHNLSERALSIHVNRCSTLSETVRISCAQTGSNDGGAKASWGEALRKEVRRLTTLHAGGRLWGMILCGPLMPDSIPPWLEPELDNLAARGLEFSGPLDEPELGHLWISPKSEDAIAEGAAIYGRRVLERKPTYLDTMPQISILAQSRSSYHWIPLLDAEEVLGGTTYQRVIKTKFKLKQGTSKLHVYLRKGPAEDIPYTAEDPHNPSMHVPHNELPSCKARLVREVIRGYGSIEAVQRSHFFRSDYPIAQYGLAFAEALFCHDTDALEEEPHDASGEPQNRPFRKTVFHFPSSPDTDMPLDTVVRMRPASGLAQVELVPIDVSFLKGRHVFLDYVAMKGASKLPKQQGGWPQIKEIIVDPNDRALRRWQEAVDRFEELRPNDDGYWNIIDQMKSMLIQKTQISLAGKQVNAHVIDQNGKPCTSFGSECIRRVSEKFERDLVSLIEAGRGMADLRNRLFVRSSWLYASTPHVIVRYVTKILSQDGNAQIWCRAAEAGSRTFTSDKYYRFLFSAIARYANRTDVKQPFPIQSARAICRVLMFKREGYNGLNRETAELFAKLAMKRIYGEEANESFAVLFFQLVLLLFYLLRFRKADPNVFDPNTDSGISVFEDAIRCLNSARHHLLKIHQRGKALRVERIIEGFKRYLHYEGGEDVVTIIGDLAGDMF